MADLRVTGGSPPALQPARPSDAARAAQRAFFQAALNEVTPSAPTRLASAQPAPTQPRAAASSASQTEPNRSMRPGSLLDITV